MVIKFIFSMIILIMKMFIINDHDMITIEMMTIMIDMMMMI
jgi:hypothetical protein